MSAASRLLAAEPLVPAENILGEGPLWVVSARRLLWTDILGKRLYTLDPDTGELLPHELTNPRTLDGALFACDRAGRGSEPYRFLT